MFSTARRALDIYMKILGDIYMKILRRRRKVQISIETADKAFLLFPFPHILKLTSENTSAHFQDIQSLKYEIQPKN